MATNRDDDAFDALIAEARADRPGPDLMARVLADAAEVQAAQTGPRVAAPARQSWLAGALGAVGGWGAASGIVAAGVMGLAVGFYAPDEIDLWLGGDTLSFGETGYAITPDLGELWTEGDDV